MALPVQGARLGLVAVLTGAVAAAGLLVPTGAAAKFTCEGRGAEPDGLALRGLPATPVAGRSYTLTVTLVDAHGPNRGPHLGGQYCGDGIDPERAPGIGGWFRRVGGGNSGVFSLNVRFPRPGSWALSVMDLDGFFYDFGLREVRSSRPAVRDAVAGALALAAAAVHRETTRVNAAVWTLPSCLNCRNSR